MLEGRFYHMYTLLDRPFLFIAIHSGDWADRPPHLPLCPEILEILLRAHFRPSKNYQASLLWNVVYGKVTPFGWINNPCGSQMHEYRYASRLASADIDHCILSLLLGSGGSRFT